MELGITVEDQISPVKPFIKWAGGKQSLADKIISFFPKNFDRYFEPFIGGGGVFFQLAHSDCIISDYNSWLIDTYIGVRDDWERVAHLLDEIRNDKETFLQVRSQNLEGLDVFERAAKFIYLNKTCFRGLFRVNKKGQFNVPYGAYQRRYYDPENLKQASERLANVDIRSGEFENGVEGAQAGDFIYMDPPYYKLGGHSDFNRYTDKQFRAEDHIRLKHLCERLHQQGVRWALSNSNTDFVKDLFQGFKIEEISAKREINLNSANRSITELLIINF